ncbi:hypothetical protein QIU18_08270 [Capnocytophaga canimorsus]|nr:hypothetical protein [Capnocytophaga canimorsus]WGU69669.1 hypothetical protein QIU18_08270 [Capnocytophaga canimorsus]
MIKRYVSFSKKLSIFSMKAQHLFLPKKTSFFNERLAKNRIFIRKKQIISSFYLRSKKQGASYKEKRTSYKGQESKLEGTRD